MPAPVSCGRLRAQRAGPNDATAVTLTVTATEPDADGYLVAFPCDKNIPHISTMNDVAGGDRSNTLHVGLAQGDAELCVGSYASSHFVLDLMGWYATTTR